MKLKTDEELVAKYQKNADILALAQLRARTMAVVQSQVNRYVAGPGHISRAALEAKADELMIDAAKSFNPNAGAAFRTHLFNYLKRLDRYTKANANIAHVPEAKANQITMFQTQMALLQDQKRRPPTDEEMADHLMWPITDVQRMNKSMRRELPDGQVGGPHLAGTQQVFRDAVTDQLLDDLYYELSHDERAVFDHLFGMHGKKKITQGQDIAKATGFSSAKVSQVRTRIAQRIQPYMSMRTEITL